MFYHLWSGCSKTNAWLLNMGNSLIDDAYTGRGIGCVVFIKIYPHEVSVGLGHYPTIHQPSTHVLSSPILNTYILVYHHDLKDG